MQISATQHLSVQISEQEQKRIAAETICQAFNIPDDARLDKNNIVAWSCSRQIDTHIIRAATDADLAAFTVLKGLA